MFSSVKSRPSALRRARLTLGAVLIGALALGGAQAAAAVPSPDSGPTAGGTTVTVENAARFVQVSAGGETAYGLDSDGHLYAWGRGQAGDLGNGTLGGSGKNAVPLRVSPGELPEGETFTRVVGGNSRAYAWGSDGRLYAWGRNTDGQLGDGTTTDRSIPVVVQRGGIPAGVDLVGLATGNGYTAAVGSDGNVYYWGSDFAVGSPGSVPVAMPRGAMPEGVRAVAVATPESAVLVLGDDGNVYGMGRGQNGQLGLAGTPWHVPALTRIDRGEIPEGVRATNLVAGVFHGVISGDDGNFYAWGQNRYGQVGVEGGDIRPTAMRVTEGVVPRDAGSVLRATSSSTSVLTSDGRVFTWGANGYPGNTRPANYWMPTEAAQGERPDGISFTALEGGDQYRIGLGSDGRVYGWGRGDSGQLGSGNDHTVVAVDTPVLGPNFAVESVSFGGVPATELTASAMSAEAVTPPHPAGAVDVDVVTGLFGGVTNAAQPHPVTYPNGFTYLEPVIAPVITTPSVPDGIVTDAYASLIEATGTAPITFTVTEGALPDGVTLNPETGELTGEPTRTGTFTFTVTATNTAGQDAREYTLVVRERPQIITPSVADATTDTAYQDTVDATGTGPITFALIDGALPEGLTIAPATGRISGTPTRAGIFPFTVSAVNEVGEDQREFTITIAADETTTIVPLPVTPPVTVTPPPTVTSTPTPTSASGLAWTGGDAPLSWIIGGTALTLLGAATLVGTFIRRRTL